MSLEEALKELDEFSDKFIIVGGKTMSRVEFMLMYSGYSGPLGSGVVIKSLINLRRHGCNIFPGPMKEEYLQMEPPITNPKTLADCVKIVEAYGFTVYSPIFPPLDKVPYKENFF